MSSIKLSPNASGTGAFTIAAPNSNTDRTLTLPDNTGTIITTGSTAGVSQTMLASGVVGNGPAFSAYRSTSAQSISSSTFTKVQLQTEEFDTASCYDNSTNYRFTPNVAGYYQVNGSIYVSGLVTRTIIVVYKNGSEFKRGTDLSTSNPIVSCLIYLNGTTDYIELFGYATGSSLAFGAAQAETYFQASMVRAA